MDRNSNRVILVVMDGVGHREESQFNAVKQAGLDFNTPLKTLINASGEWVGLNKTDMGNSEVGHNTMGAGKIYKQGSALVGESLKIVKIFNSDVWRKLVNNVNNNNSTFHLVGLLSDGGVHSDIKHLKNMLYNLYLRNVKKVRIHILLDGRDVEPQSALKYVKDIEDYINLHSFPDYAIASGGGRMAMIMDRYNADLEMVKRGFDCVVNGKGNKFQSATQAINSAYSKDKNIVDQDIEPFVIVKDNIPVGLVNDGDSMLLFNFRADRAVEFSEIFCGNNLKYYILQVPNIMYAGMCKYDGDNGIPRNYLVEAPEIYNTLEEYLIQNGKRTYAVSETQKFGHITKYFNGNHIEKFDDYLQTFEEITSYSVPFEQQPEMRANDIKEALIYEIQTQRYDLLKCNFANGDMIGHTGDYEATCKAMQTVKECVEEITQVAKEYGYNLIVLADHGNSEEMATYKDGKWIPKTSHTTNKVPLYIFTEKNVKLKSGEFGLSNIAKTITDLMQLEGAADWDESIITK